MSANSLKVKAYDLGCYGPKGEPSKESFSERNMTLGEYLADFTLQVIKSNFKLLKTVFYLMNCNTCNFLTRSDYFLMRSDYM